jgi:nitrite reductase/ring-hydroxylating ferredoxin subunit
MAFAAARLDELEEGKVTLVQLDGRKVVLVRREGEVYALQGICSHAKSVLGPGRLTEEGLIECPMHAALFSPVDGSVCKGPALTDLETYETAVEDGIVYVALPERGPEAATQAARPERWW